MNEQERKAVQALLDALKDHEQALAKLGLRRNRIACQQLEEAVRDSSPACAKRPSEIVGDGLVARDESASRLEVASHRLQ